MGPVLPIVINGPIIPIVNKKDEGSSGILIEEYGLL